MCRSTRFVNWINNTLGIVKTANVIWNGEEQFDFSVLETPEKLEEAIKGKLAQGYTARLTAGFCWDWSKELTGEGMLKGRRDRGRIPSGMECSSRGQEASEEHPQSYSLGI